VHFAEGTNPTDYLGYVRKKYLWIVAGIILTGILFVYSISVGAIAIPPLEVVQTLLGQTVNPKWDTIIWEIRLPQALTAIVAGIGLAVAGVAMQSILRNPLASPFTLGVSSAGAFGAAFAIIVIGTGEMHSRAADAISIGNPYTTTVMAFVFCMLATCVILAISKMKGASPEAMILTGVALSSLFAAGTMVLQYMSSDTQLAAVVFWTFGDVSRANWEQLGIMAVIVAAGTLYFIANRWNYNAIDAGDETAQGLGVPVEHIRLVGMVVATLIAAVIVAFLGVIGFVGLVCPHMVRRIIGDDQRYLIPGSCVMGAILLLASDTAARLVLAPYVLPVAVLTAFMGAPVFIYLIIRGYRR
jgi:iron complex transport system permease protein